MARTMSGPAGWNPNATRELEDHASALFQQTLWKNSENLTENQHVTGRRGIGAGRCAHSRRVISA
jgi:hypothetical protein